MQKVAIILISSLLISACAGTRPAVKADLSKPKVAEAVTPKAVTPFASEAEEAYFWQVVNGEVALDAHDRNMPLSVKLGMLLHMALSPAVDAETRTQAAVMLLQSAPLGFKVEQNQILDEAFLSDNLIDRVSSLRHTFKMNEHTLAIINYALNNEPQMKAFMAKQRAKELLLKENPDAKPLEDPGKPPIPSPVQHF